MILKWRGWAMTVLYLDIKIYEIFFKKKKKNEARTLVVAWV
jgi:hypothetical protein